MTTLHELKKSTLKSYIDKATGDAVHRRNLINFKRSDDVAGDTAAIKKRNVGIEKAQAKIVEAQYNVGSVSKVKPEDHPEPDEDDLNGQQDQNGDKDQDDNQQIPPKKEEPVKESKMSELHAAIQTHLQPHIDDYKKHGGAEHFANKIEHATRKIANETGHPLSAVTHFVNQHLDSELKESIEYIMEAEEKGASAHNQNYADAYEIGTALHLHHMTGSKTNPDKAHQDRMSALHKKGREAFDKLPEHLKHRALNAAHESAKAYLNSLEHNHGIKAKDIEEVHHTSKGISHLVGHHVPQNEAPHDVVIKTKKGQMHGASLKATAGTASNNSPSIVHGLPGVYERGLKRVGLHDKSVAERKAVRGRPEMIDNARKTQQEAAAHHTKVFNAMKPSEQKEHVQHLIRHNPDTPIHLDYVNGQKGTSTPYEKLPHVAKTLAAKHFVAKHEPGSNLVKIHAVHPDKSEHHITTVEHRYTHGPHVSPQVNAKLATMKD